jgi:uncharacterized Rossmann fold enzyme
MIWNEWKKQYYEVIKRLNINEKDDQNSAKYLGAYFSDLLKQKSSSIIQKLQKIFQYPIIIAGAGPSLEYDFNVFLKMGFDSRIKIISVDGATALFRIKSINPDVVVTDLDGDLTSIKWAISCNALTLIHAHGDNLHLISQFFSENESIIRNYDVWGTTQCRPDKGLLNYGGFTDGDRAIFMAFHFQTPLIGLIGFDFGEIIGKYSTYNSQIQKSQRLKQEKLKIALNLISSYFNQHNGIRFNLTAQGVNIPGFPRTNISNFLNKAIEVHNTHNKRDFPR